MLGDLGLSLEIWKVAFSLFGSTVGYFLTIAVQFSVQRILEELYLPWVGGGGREGRHKILHSLFYTEIISFYFHFFFTIQK